MLVQRLQAEGIEVQITSSIDELCEQTAGAPQDDGTVVVAAGGDGTLSLVADNVPEGMPIVPMPLGTENLLARHFGYTADAEKVAGTIQQGRSHRIDAGRAGGKLFLVMATCGFDAEVVRAVDLRRQGHIRRLDYAAPIIRAMRRYRFPKIRVQTMDIGDGAEPDVRECGWAMVFNLPCYGGHLHLERQADCMDGQLDVVTFRRGSILSGLCYLVGVVLRIHGRMPGVIRTRTQSIELTSSGRVPYQLDGDYGGHLPLKIEILPQHVHLLLPSD